MQHLVWYNTKRPHLSLDLKSPLQYVLDNDQNSRMWWTSTTQPFVSSNNLLTTTSFGGQWLTNFAMLVDSIFGYDIV
ncbi:MAG: hypothetical protein HC932_06535 [Thermales bacterium]|nr:hypothetical protein [Thermales bacterium]